jgi:hypothetical protein
MTDFNGTDAELPGLLTDVYACNRVWSAWSAGTMTEDDFVPAAQDEDVRADLIAWRDAARTLTDWQRFQVSEARDVLSRWDAGRDDSGIYDREKVLADQARSLLAIVASLAAAEADR